MKIKNSKLIYFTDKNLISSYSLSYQKNDINFLDCFLLCTKCSEIITPTNKKIEEIMNCKWSGVYNLNLNFTVK